MENSTTFWEIAKVAGPYLVMAIGALWALLNNRIKRADKKDDYERAQLIPTSVWLEKEKQWNADIKALNVKVDNVVRENMALREENLNLKAEIRDLRHQVKNVQATQMVEADVRKLERETATGEIKNAVDESMGKITV